MIEKLEHLGVLIRECTLPGETRAGNVVPAHPNGIQVSARRWMLIYATRRFRAVDDDCSIVWQLRDGAPDGALVREGFFSRSHGEWNPPGGGGPCWKQHGHPMLFGVPKGARIGGRLAANANVFVAKWRTKGLRVEQDAEGRQRVVKDEELVLRTQAVEWMQFRLNDAEDGLEVVKPIAAMRQRGYADGPDYCERPGALPMNQTFVQAVPLDPAAAAWGDMHHFSQGVEWPKEGCLAVIQYVFDARAGHYVWARTGPYITLPGRGLGEASLIPYRGGWLISARQGRGAGQDRAGAAWFRLDDPLGPPGQAFQPEQPACWAPQCAYQCADGVVRLFTGDPTVSPYKNGRAPLYAWEIDPDQGFACSEPRVLFDPVAAGLPLTEESGRIVDMCKLLPPQGCSQVFVHRVRAKAIDFPYTQSLITPEQKAACAIYYGRITYQETMPPPWTFA